MDFRLTKEQVEFQEEVRDFLRTEKEKGIYTFGDNHFVHLVDKRFSKQMAKKGWIGVAWPKEYGGKGMGYINRLILLEEMFKAGAPLGYHFLGDRQVGPGIYHSANKSLRDKFLPKILNADIGFCVLFSEPDAGSDVASGRTTAIEEGDHFVINGQKVWTSSGHLLEYGWTLVKTNLDPDVSKYDSFSQIIVDMKSPGITVSPLINAAGVHSFNEVFFDNVKVPKDNLAGEMNKGFRYTMVNLDYERAGLERLMQNYSVKEALIDYAKTHKRNGRPLSEDSLIRDTIAKLEIEYEVARRYIYFVASISDKGRLPNFEAAMGKTISNLFESKLADVASTILGLHGLLMPGSAEALYDGCVADSYLWSPSYTLQGGSVEILKNIIALRGLKLAKK
ncbi:MAG: hypothetical protein B1H11_11725 [Desulfobacteraceae bacterium 4484_190.1]|nr:MAG: hypothetical protein B1H11_11725 [Desulfobacteraceae bacterium 4484_190.1]